MTQKFIQRLFAISCWIIFLFMALYWFYKFKVEDRDIAVLDLLTLEEANDVKFPVSTICMVHPFRENRLKEYQPSISSKAYLNHLKGLNFEDHLQNIDFENITVNLGDYFLNVTEKWKNDTDIFIDSSLVVKHETAFNGFNEKDQFIKCFSIQLDLSNHRYIKAIGIHYDKARLMADWCHDADEEVDGNGSQSHGFSNDADGEVEGSGSQSYGFSNDTDEEVDGSGSQSYGFSNDTDEEVDGSSSQSYGFNNDTTENTEGKGSKLPRLGINFHEQGQFFLGGEKNDPSLENYLTEDEFNSIEFWMKDFEVMRRRNKNSQPCLEDQTAYDRAIIEKHLYQKRCRPPYLNSESSFPLCNSSVEMDFAKLTFGKTKGIEVLKPCYRITKLGRHPVKFTTRTTVSEILEKGLSIYINFPEEVKMIAQNQEVDVHSLIGNIGGYLGLFTGYAVIQIPNLILSIRKKILD